MTRWLHGFGGLRLLLLATVAVLVVLGPFSGGPVRLEGFAFVTTMLAPVAFAIFAFVLPLDMIMTALFRTDARDEKRAALGRVLVAEGAMLVLLALTWAPFVSSMLRLR